MLCTKEESPTPLAARCAARGQLPQLNLGRSEVRTGWCCLVLCNRFSYMFQLLSIVHQGAPCIATVCLQCALCVALKASGSSTAAPVSSGSTAAALLQAGCSPAAVFLQAGRTAAAACLQAGCSPAAVYLQSGHTAAAACLQAGCSPGTGFLQAACSCPASRRPPSCWFPASKLRRSQHCALPSQQLSPLLN